MSIEAKIQNLEVSEYHPTTDKYTRSVKTVIVYNAKNINSNSNKYQRIK